MGKAKDRREVPHKHHFVSQFHLRYFANLAEQLQVHRLDRKAPFPAMVRDTGHRNYGHSLYLPGRDPDHASLERGMADLERHTKAVVQNLVNTSGNGVEGEDRVILSYYIALQWSRNRFLLDYVRSSALEGSSGDVAGEDLIYAQKSAGLIAIVMRVVDSWASRDDPTVRPKDKWNLIVSCLEDFTWRLERYRSPALVIADSVVCLSGLVEGQTSELPSAWHKHGAGIGWENCARVTVPLTPRLGLHLTRSERPRNISAQDFNSYTVFNSREFVAFDPAWAATAPALHRQVIEDLEFQRLLRPAFNYPG